MKIQNTYQVRDLAKAGDVVLESYLSELFQFSIQSFKVPNDSIKFHSSRLTHLW